MGTFITGNDALPEDRTNAPGLALASQTYQVDAAFFNTILSALGDLRSHTKGWLTPQDFGGVCDGVADDTTAMQDLITWVSLTPSTVVIPGPTRVTTNLTIPSTSPVRFEGNGVFTGTGAVIFSPFGGAFDVKGFGAKGDGSTDDSSAIQAAIDAAASHSSIKTVVIPSGTFMASGIALSGSTYNGVRILGQGGLLKMRADGGASTFGGAWVGLLVKDCSRVTLDNLKWHGNRTIMTQREQIFCVGIAGATDVSIPNIEFEEIRGDGLYIGQSQWTSSSALPERIHVGRISATNSTDDGRQCVSIISGRHINIGNLYSFQVGGIINSVTQPGGLDIEPDQGYHVCEDVSVGWAHVVTAGTSGIAVLGKAITDIATRDWNTKRIYVNGYVLRTGTSGSGIAPAGIDKCTDVTLNVKAVFAATRGQAWAIDNCDRVSGRVEAQNVTNGVLVGYSEEARDCRLDIVVNNYSTAGLRTAKVTRCEFRGSVKGPANNTCFGVQCHDTGRGSIVQTDCVYSIDIPFDSGVSGPVRAFRNEPGNLVTYTRSVVRDCGWNGYANHSVTCDAAIFRINVRGWNYATAMPSTASSWLPGEIVWRDPVGSNISMTGAQMVQSGWQRLTTGTGHVSGTDWAIMHVSHVSPAT